jgi:serine/threonine protein kinase
MTEHPNIIQIYDTFLVPDSMELYLVFEAMEGDLYQLIRSRKGRHFEFGLLSSIFHQIVSGLNHIHSAGVVHRNMRPESILVTTTGIIQYSSIPQVLGTDVTMREIIVIVKITNVNKENDNVEPFMTLARRYHAPEVLLQSRNYSYPVDMWALGTIMVELINLKPLFKGASETDVLIQICDILGDPYDDHRLDARGRPIGGGIWNVGIDMAMARNFTFPPVRSSSLE